MKLSKAIGGLSIEQISRCIRKVDIEVQIEFQEKVCELTEKPKNIRITNEAGTDIHLKKISLL